MTMNIHSISSNVPVGPLDIGEAGTSTRSPEAGGATTLLPEPMTVLAGADMAAQITALAVKAGQEQQDIDTKSTEAEDAVQDQADQAEVATMHEEASTIRAGAWESGILQSRRRVHDRLGRQSVGANAGSKAAGIATGLKGSADILNGAATLAGGLEQGRRDRPRGPGCRVEGARGRGRAVRRDRARQPEGCVGVHAGRHRFLPGVPVDEGPVGGRGRARGVTRGPARRPVPV